MGVRLKRLREERRLTQQALADAIGLSLSYLNQIENNQRPLTVPVLLRLNSTFGVDVQLFSEDDEARLVAELREGLSDPLIGTNVSLAEIREIAANMPSVARAVVALHKRLSRSLDEAAALAAKLGDDRRPRDQVASAAVEEVRDFFYARHNHIDALDRAAEAVSIECGDTGPDAIAERLRTRHGIRVVHEEPRSGQRLRRSYNEASRRLCLPKGLAPGQQAFQLATQLALLEHGALLDDQIAGTAFVASDARALARIGLANYFAGALILPYGRFLREADELRYDIDLLGQRFGVGFETVCHRLSTLQRAGARGVPFFFVRVDRAGNISKRQSATDFHFSRAGGTCPLWNVYDAFSQPTRILTQLAEMPDGRTYLWVARAVSHAAGGYGTPEKSFAVGLGCDLRHAPRLVYSMGLRLDDPGTRTPIGAGCKICDRTAFPQRAFPCITTPSKVDENVSTFAPYAS
jgi:XRE family transcriptional regulator, fatty acid utilization regulator